jgi:hypothetical protein
MMKFVGDGRTGDHYSQSLWEWVEFVNSSLLSEDIRTRRKKVRLSLSGGMEMRVYDTRASGVMRSSPRAPHHDGLKIFSFMF